MPRRARLYVLAALCIGAGFWVGQRIWTSRQAATVPPAATQAVVPTRVPDIRLRDLTGATRSISEWQGQALIINFWATWCAPCRKEMPLLEQVHQERRGKGIAVVGIAIDREEPVRTFVGETGVSYTILVGEQDAMAAAEAFGPDFVGLPLTAIAAPGGEILKLHVGELHAGDLAFILGVLDQLLAGRISVPEARRALEQA